MVCHRLLLLWLIMYLAALTCKTFWTLVMVGYALPLLVYHVLELLLRTSAKQSHKISQVCKVTNEIWERLAGSEERTNEKIAAAGVEIARGMRKEFNEERKQMKLYHSVR